MDKHRYTCLLEEMCEHIGLDHREHFLRTGLLRVGATDMLLQYDDLQDPQYLQIRIDCGEADNIDREYLWRKLLNCNFVWGQGGYLVFSVIPDNDHVVLALKHTLRENITGRELADWLAFAAAESAMQWKHILQACNTAANGLFSMAISA